MNLSMTRTTKNSQIIQLIVLMAFIHMMYMQRAFRFAYETFVFVMRKCTFSIIATSFAIIFVFLSSTFKRMKNGLLTFIRAKFRRVLSTSLRLVHIAAKLTNLFNFSRPIYFIRDIAITRTIRNRTVFALRNVTRSFQERFFTAFTNKFNFIIPRTLITEPRT